MPDNKGKKKKKNKAGRPKNCGRCKKPKSKCKCGRPTVMTKDVINKLEQAYSNGATDIQACFYAGISTSALDCYQKKNPKFKERKAGLKAQLGLISKNNIAKSIKGGSTYDSWKHLEATEKQVYSKRVEQDVNHGGSVELVKIIDDVPRGK